MRAVKTILLTAGLTAVYIGLALVGLSIQIYDFSSTVPFWPAAGFGLALIWLYRWRFAAVIFLGEFLFGIWRQHGIPDAIAAGVIALAATAMGAWLLWRASVAPALNRLRDVVLFLLLGVLPSAALAGFAGAAALLGTGVIAAHWYWFNAWTWGLGDATGILIVAPLITHWRHGWPFTRRQGIAWGAIMVVTLALSLAIMLWVNAPRQLLFLLLPMAIAAAFAGGAAGASSVAALLAVCVLGLNLSQVNNGLTIAIRLLFVGTAAVTGYLLAAALAERRRATARLAHQALHDSLTGLANRAAFDAQLKSIAASEGSHALLYLDLDQFKLLNDSRGHEMGDRFLVGMAAKLAAVAPPGVMVARLGGDEFGILVPESNEAATNELAEALRQAVLDYVYIEDGLGYRVGVSIGLTLFGAGESPAAILSRADIACYAAKAEGRNRTHAYRRDDPTMQADHLEIQRVAQLHAALADGSFQLVRQLIAPLDGDTRQPPFYELLLRLADADGRLLAPGGFLDVAARYGLMPIIDRWVMEQSFRYLAATVRPMRLSINLSGLTLNEPRFFDDVVALQERYGIDSADICFEVTESVAIERLTRAVAMMNRLVEAGFSFSLDDFGNGVASFGYLQELPVDFVKIDGRFIRDIQDDPANAVIVESLVKLADVKHIGCIGEWIETREVLEQVKALGVGYGQGYYLHLPEPLALHSPTRQTAS